MMACSASFGLSIVAEAIIAIGMGINNAAGFEIVPKCLPEAVGGVSGWVGGLGALGGFVLPPAIALVVELGIHTGYSNSFLLFAGLAVICILIFVRLGRGPIVSVEQQRRKIRVA